MLNCTFKTSRRAGQVAKDDEVHVLSLVGRDGSVN